MCYFSCGFSCAAYWWLFPRWKTLHSGDCFTLNLIFSWMVFCSPADSFHYPTQLLLMICHRFSAVLSSCLTAFDFLSLLFAPITYLLNDLRSSLTGALSISKWPGTTYSSAILAFLDCPTLFICSPTILLYRGLPNAVLSSWSCPTQSMPVIL